MFLDLPIMVDPFETFNLVVLGLLVDDEAGMVFKMTDDEELFDVAGEEEEPLFTICLLFESIKFNGVVIMVAASLALLSLFIFFIVFELNTFDLFC